jgi:hypothetical protein
MWTKKTKGVAVEGDASAIADPPAKPIEKKNSTSPLAAQHDSHRRASPARPGVKAAAFATVKFNFLEGVARDHREMTATTGSVAMILATCYMNEGHDGVAWVSEKQLCDDLGLSPASTKSVGEALQRLVERGHLVAEPRPGFTTKYRIAPRYFGRRLPPAEMTRGTVSGPRRKSPPPPGESHPHPPGRFSPSTPGETHQTIPVYESRIRESRETNSVACDAANREKLGAEQPAKKSYREEFSQFISTLKCHPMNEETALESYVDARRFESADELMQFAREHRRQWQDLWKAKRELLPSDPENLLRKRVGVRTVSKALRLTG